MTQARFPIDDRNRAAWAAIVERAWNDATFRQQLLSNPDQVIREEMRTRGIQVPEGVRFNLQEGGAGMEGVSFSTPGATTPGIAQLVLPPKPEESASLSSAAQQVAAALDPGVL